MDNEGDSSDSSDHDNGNVRVRGKEHSIAHMSLHGHFSNGQYSVAEEVGA